MGYILRRYKLLDRADLSVRRFSVEKYLGKKSSLCARMVWEKEWGVEYKLLKLYVVGMY